MKGKALGEELEKGIGGGIDERNWKKELEKGIEGAIAGFTRWCMTRRRERCFVPFSRLFQERHRH